MEKVLTFDELATDIRCLLRVAQTPAAAIPEFEWPEPTTQEVLNVDSCELAENFSADDDESADLRDQVKAPACVLLDRRVRTTKHDNSYYLSELAVVFGFDIAYAVGLTWDAYLPTVDGSGPAFIGKTVLAGYRLSIHPQLLILADDFYQHVAGLCRGTYERRNDSPKRGEASYLYAVSCYATCRPCCEVASPGHVHRVVLVGLRRAGSYGGGLSKKQKAELHTDISHLVRRRLQYPSSREANQQTSAW